MNSFYGQSELRMVGEVRQPKHIDADIVTRLPTFRSSLRHAIAHSGIDQEEVAGALEIDAGDFCRMVKEPRHAAARQRNLPAEKIPNFCRVTGSLAPVQWLDAQLGLAPVARLETRRERLIRELAEEEARAA